MIRICVVKSLVLLHTACMQGCTVTVASHPSFVPVVSSANITNGQATTYQARTQYVGNPAPSVRATSTGQVSVTPRGLQATTAAPVQNRMTQYQMKFSDFFLNSFTQLLMICAVGGKCK